MFAESLIALTGFLALQTHADARPLNSALPLNRLPIAKYVAPAVTGPINTDPESIGVKVAARAATIMDVGTGNVLFQKDAENAYPIASLTKLITVMTVLDAKPDLDEEVTVEDADDPHEGRSVFLPQEKFTKRELVRAVLVGSVNTAANTLARTWGKREEFVKAMNAKAVSLNMTHASFADPTGLDLGNRASAKDIALALRAALSYSEIRTATELDAYEVKGRASNHVYKLKATNLLLNSFLNKQPYRIVAGKTGSLPEAGYSLAQATRNEGGHEIITVVLGSDDHFSRFQDAKALTAWAFDHFEWR